MILSRDLSYLTEPAVRKLTEELVEVETGFQLEDFFVLVKRLLPSLKYLSWSLEQLENLIDWWRDMEPLLKLAVPKLVDYLDDLEQKGIFRINAAVLEMYGKIATHYDAEDIAAMGDGFVLMHGMVKKLSNPEMIRFLDKLTDVPLEVNLDEVKPVGPLVCSGGCGARNAKKAWVFWWNLPRPWANSKRLRLKVLDIVLWGCTGMGARVRGDGKVPL